MCLNCFHFDEFTIFYIHRKVIIPTKLSHSVMTHDTDTHTHTSMYNIWYQNPILPLSDLHYFYSIVLQTHQVAAFFSVSLSLSIYYSQVFWFVLKWGKIGQMGVCCVLPLHNIKTTKVFLWIFGLNAIINNTNALNSIMALQLCVFERECDTKLGGHLKSCDLGVWLDWDLD